MILCCGILLDILLDTSALDVLQLHDIVELSAVNTVGIVDVTVRVTHCHGDGTQLQTLLGSILGHITGTRDQHLLTLELDAACSEHGGQEINRAVACSLWTNQRSAEGNTFTCQYTLELVGEFLVLPEQVANLTATDTDVTSGNVLIGTNHAVKLVHECLTETHHLSITLATGREV